MEFSKGNETYNSYNNYYTPKCSKNLNDIMKDKKLLIDKITDSFKFSFLKLYEEVELKPEHIEFIEKEPIDVLIKYIDLRDEKLNREGIKQTYKDEDNEELKYSVRSVLQNIPWIRKIFILMPNEKVKYFKPIDEISDKFVYVKDKDLIGFDSANSNVFQYHLSNMTKFGLSENFILMDDDCFFGKPINKSNFFYYDEEQKKVLPSVVTDDFNELNKNDNLNEYKRLARKRYSIKVHSFFGWKLAQLSAFKLLLEQFKPPLINAGFNHNAIPLNTNDLKEIFELIKDKYEYSKETLYSKTRTPYDLQSQSLFNSYLLNVKKRKVNSIPWVYYDLGALKGKDFDIEMFVINTSGDRFYSKSQYQYAKSILEKKFNTPTPYEIDSNSILDNNSSKINSNNISYNDSDNNLYNISDNISDTSMNNLNYLSNNIMNNISTIISSDIINNSKNISNNNNNDSRNIIDLNIQKELLVQENNELKKKINEITNEKILMENKLKKIENFEKKYNNLLSYLSKIIIIVVVIIIVIYIIKVIFCANKKDNFNTNEIHDNSTNIKGNTINNEDENIKFS